MCHRPRAPSGRLVRNQDVLDSAARGPAGASRSAATACAAGREQAQRAAAQQERQQRIAFSEQRREAAAKAEDDLTLDSVVVTGSRVTAPDRQFRARDAAPAAAPPPPPPPAASAGSDSRRLRLVIRVSKPFSRVVRSALIVCRSWAADRLGVDVMFLQVSRWNQCLS